MTTKTDLATLPAGVYSDGSRLWRAKPGATSTFAENVAARVLFIELHADEFWNPWRMEEQATELERAMQVMQEWERAEPGLKRKTKRQLDADMARWERECERNRVKREQDRQANLKRYDPEREQDRLALLEHQCVLSHKTSEVAKLHSGEAFPAMDPKRRAEQVAELDEAVARHRAAVERLTPAVGDPEDVVDRNGHLPRDRRHSTLYYYRERRIAEVRSGRAKLPKLDAQIKATEDKSERSKLRAQRDILKWRLDKLLAVARLEAEDMCADCATPANMHGYVSPPFDHPCPAWPANAAHLKKFREMFDEMVRRNEARKAEETPLPPKPEPLAVIPSRLPIAEVVQRLQELQEQYPDAEVRRGRANRWELWPANSNQASAQPGDNRSPARAQAARPSEQLRCR
jgi:hypothetical protein